LNFDNGHRPRQGQHNNNNKNRNRGRNNRRPGGGGGNQNNSGGNPLNRVYESNGPDVKVRGTAQTIAEKYMQLGRDAQSSGDTVMSESYFQFSEHYFRVWAAAQPVGQPTQQLRRPDDEEYEETREEGAEGDGNAAPEGEDTNAPEQPLAQAEGMVGEQEGDRPEQRNTRQRDNRERFRPRWQSRRDQQNQDQSRDGDAEPRVMDDDAQPREAMVEPRQQAHEEEAGGQWEAPSFLRRPAAGAASEDVSAEPVAEKRNRAPRRPRTAATEEAAPSDDTPQGE
jgi:Domain of unknown function (DUF4167)